LVSCKHSASGLFSSSQSRIICVLERIEFTLKVAIFIFYLNVRYFVRLPHCRDFKGDYANCKLKTISPILAF